MAQTLTELLVRVGADIQQFQKEFSEVDRTVGALGKSMTDVGTKLTAGLTLPIVALGGFALKSSIDFEQAMANVAKTTDLVGGPLERIGDELTRLSETIPVSASELANLAATAAQLGIKTEDLTEFTRVMSALGVATDVSAEEAATAIAQLANITGLSRNEFERFGSVLVELGNKGASTESAILFMAQRIAAAGSIIGLTEDEILAFSAAAANTGLEVEMAGTAISKTFRDIGAAVSRGGEELDAFAVVAGMSAGKFAKLFKDDASAAVSAFIAGLGRMHSEGKNIAIALEDLGIKEARQLDAVQRLAKAYGGDQGLASMLSIASAEMKENNALANESERFYNTTGAELKKLWNEVTNTARAFGDELVPMLRALLNMARPVLEVIGNIAEAFGKLSEPIQVVIVTFIALLAALGPLLVIAGQMATAFITLKPVLLAVGGAIAGLSLPVLAAIAAVTALAVAAYFLITRWEEVKAFVGRLIDAIRQAFVDRFNAIVNSIKAKVDAVTGFFKGMYDKVVGNSYVPDLMKGIQREFARLNSVMVQPTVAATSATSAAFGSLASNIDLFQRLLDRQAAAVERLKELRLDLAFASSAKEAKALTEKVAEAEAELRKLNKTISSMQDLRLLMGAPTVKPGLAGGDDKDGTKTPDSVSKLTVALNELVPPITATTRSLSTLDIAMLKLNSAVEQAGDFLLKAGKGVLSGVVNLFGGIVSILNPLTFVTTAFDQAIRNATSGNEKLKASMDRIVGIIMEALQPALEAMGPVFDALTPIIRDLAPLIKAVAQIFAALFRAVAPILHALVPLLKALFPIFKFVAIIATFLGQAVAFAGKIIFTVASFIAKAVGTVIKGIGSLIDKIPGLGDFGLKKAGQGLINLGDSFGDTAKSLGEAFDELGKAREEIKKITLEEPAEQAKESLGNVSEAAEGAADALNEIAAIDPVKTPPNVEITITFNGPITTADAGELGDQISSRVLESINTGLGYAAQQDDRVQGNMAA